MLAMPMTILDPVPGGVVDEEVEHGDQLSAPSPRPLRAEEFV